MSKLARWAKKMLRRRARDRRAPHRGTFTFRAIMIEILKICLQSLVRPPGVRPSPPATVDRPSRRHNDRSLRRLLRPKRAPASKPPSVCGGEEAGPCDSG